MEPQVESRAGYNEIKTAIHRKLINKLNLDKITQMDRGAVQNEVASVIEGLVIGESTPMTLQERERLSREVLDEVFGLGPLEPLLKDPAI